MHLNISELQTQQIMRQLKSGEVDIGILATPLEDDELLEIPLYYEQFLLFVSHRHALFGKSKVQMDELNIADLLLLEEGHCFRTQALSLCSGRKKSKVGNVRYLGGSIETLMQIVQRGTQFTIVPELSVRTKDHQRLSIPFSGTPPVREVSLAVHRRFAKKGVLDYLKRYIQAQLPENLVQPKSFKRIAWK